MAKRTKSKRSHQWAPFKDKQLSAANPRNNFKFHRYGCAPPPYRTLSDMTEIEILALEQHYGCPVIRPDMLG